MESEPEPEPEPEPACSLATRCKVGWQGDRACGPNSHCDRKQGVCVCNSPAQDYPNCCWPSCRGMDAVCVNGGPCQCIGNGKYPDCEEVCGEGCGDGEICKKVGNVAKCVCKSNFIRRGGVCKPCTQESGATMMESANSESEPTCSPATRCKVGKEGDRA